MAGNPYLVQGLDSLKVVNPLESLMMGQKAYGSAQEGMQKQRVSQARESAAQAYKSGDAKGALATLMGVNDYDGVKTLGTLDQQQWTRGHTEKRDAVGDQQWAATHGLARQNADRLGEGPEVKANARAKVAGQYGIKQGTPEFNAFVLNGELPTQSSTVTAQTEQRKAAAAGLGMTPDNPGYQSFVLTGKMPREDAPPLTATDKKAILEADEGVMSANVAIDALRKATDLSAKAFEGPAASTRGYAASFLGENSDIGKGGLATAELENLVTSNALSQLKSIFGGMPTEGERKILLEIQGSVNQPHAVRKKIYERATQMAQSRLKFNEQRAAEMRGGQFYKPQGSMTRAPVAQPQGAITQQQYEALPSGSPFTAPDGSQRIKP